MLQDIYPRKMKIDYLNRAPKAIDYVIAIKGGSVLVTDNPEALAVPRVEELAAVASGDSFRYLFAIDEDCYYLYTGDEAIEEFGPYTYAVVNTLRRYQPRYSSYAIQTGWRLGVWYAHTSYCGCCGSRMVHAKSLRAMECPNCGNQVFPTISPCVIVLIRDGERTLLTRYQAGHNFYRNYALVAGYVETGEIPEEAVAREVMEEVGIKVKNITYYKSQPWPLSGTLLLGYVCDLDGDDRIVRDNEELEEAVWMYRADLPDRSGDVSLTSDMIENYRLGRL